MKNQIFVLFTIISFCVLKNSECGMTMEQIEKVGSGMKKSCLSKVPIDPELAANVRNGGFPDDPDFKCYLRCMTKMGKGIKNGKLDETMIMTQMSMMPTNSDQLIAAAKKCFSVTGVDECDLCYQFLKCQYEADPAIFFFP